MSQKQFKTFPSFTYLVTKFSFSVLYISICLYFVAIMLAAFRNNHTFSSLDLVGHRGQFVQWEVCLGPPLFNRHICAGRVS